MAREDIGELDHHCGVMAYVRKDRNGRLYVNCPGCGILKYNLPAGQDYILGAARMYGPAGRPADAPPAPTPNSPPPAAPSAPAPAAVVQPVPAKEPPPPPKPAPRRGLSSILDSI